MRHVGLKQYLVLKQFSKPGIGQVDVGDKLYLERQAGAELVCTGKLEELVEAPKPRRRRKPKDEAPPPEEPEVPESEE